MVSLFRPTRLMLLDDHALILQGMSQLLKGEQDMTVVGAFTQSQQLIQAMSQAEVDVVLMDYTLSPGEVDGLNLIRGLRIRFPKVRILVISAMHTPATVALALRCGAAGFLGKDMCTSELLIAIRRLANGKDYLHPKMQADLLDGQVSTSQEDRPGSFSSIQVPTLDNSIGLSLREREVLRCCLDGMSVTQIAAKFERSIKTISTQKRAAYKKLGVNNDNELFKIRSQLDR